MRSRAGGPQSRSRRVTLAATPRRSRPGDLAAVIRDSPSAATRRRYLVRIAVPGLAASPLVATQRFANRGHEVEVPLHLARVDGPLAGQVDVDRRR